MVSNMQSTASNLRRALVAEFKSFYQHADAGALDRLERLYTDDVEFRDPLHSLHGRLALRRHLRGLYQGYDMIRFDYLHESVQEDTAHISWEMTCRHRRLNRGRDFKVRGMTLVRFTDRIFYQEDFYDIGQALYCHIPVLGSALRWINRRLSA